MGNCGYCVHTQSILIIHKNTLLYFPITKKYIILQKEKVYSNQNINMHHAFICLKAKHTEYVKVSNNVHENSMKLSGFSQMCSCRTYQYLDSQHFTKIELIFDTSFWRIKQLQLPNHWYK